MPGRCMMKAEQRGNSAKDIFEFKHAVSPVRFIEQRRNADMTNIGITDTSISADCLNHLYRRITRGHSV